MNWNRYFLVALRQDLVQYKLVLNSLYSQEWPWTYPSGPPSWVLGLQVNSKGSRTEEHKGTMKVKYTNLQNKAISSKERPCYWVLLQQLGLLHSVLSITSGIRAHHSKIWSLSGVQGSLWETSSCPLISLHTCLTCTGTENAIPAWDQWRSEETRAKTQPPSCEARLC